MKNNQSNIKNIKTQLRKLKWDSYLIDLASSSKDPIMDQRIVRALLDLHHQKGYDIPLSESRVDNLSLKHMYNFRKPLDSAYEDLTLQKILKSAHLVNVCKRSRWEYQILPSKVCKLYLQKFPKRFLNQSLLKVHSIIFNIIEDTDWVTVRFVSIPLLLTMFLWIMPFISLRVAGIVALIIMLYILLIIGVNRHVMSLSYMTSEIPHYAKDPIEEHKLTEDLVDGFNNDVGVFDSELQLGNHLIKKGYPDELSLALLLNENKIWKDKNSQDLPEILKYSIFR